MNETKINKITEKISNQFRTFGGGKESGWGNPLVEMLEDSELQFAGGVSVEEVVKAVLEESHLDSIMVSFMKTVDLLLKKINEANIEIDEPLALEIGVAITQIKEKYKGNF